MKKIEVQVKQIKHHRTKPKVSISLDLARKMISAADVDVEKGHAYHIYECGHVLDKEDDNRVSKYVPDENGHSRVLRICPVCWENLGVISRLLTKYKRCGCGAEQSSLRVQPSVCCAECPSITKEKKGVLPQYLTYFNEGQRDTSRWRCIHRKDCINKYIMKGNYEALPCKGCVKYEEKEGVWY